MSDDCTKPDCPICEQHRKEAEGTVKVNGHEEACNCQECLQYEIEALERTAEKYREQLEEVDLVLTEMRWHADRGLLGRVRAVLGKD